MNHAGEDSVTAEPPPPGWYPDPSGAARQRYFDGNDWIDEYTPLGEQLSYDERVQRLDAVVAAAVQNGARVKSHTRFQAVLTYGDPPNDWLHDNVLHAIITVFSCGTWLPIWLLILVTQRQRPVTFTVDPYGNVIQS